jgi:hypothetical protein
VNQNVPSGRMIIAPVKKSSLNITELDVTKYEVEGTNESVVLVGVIE